MADDDKGAKKSGKLKWIILLLILLLLLGGGGFVAWKFFLDKPDTESPQAQTEQSAGSGGEVSPKDAQVVSLPTFLVNLADPLGRRYIKLTLDVELVNPAAGAQLEGAMPRVRDAIILLLSSKSYADLAPLENKLLLKNEIVTRLNQVLGGSKVLRVYFTDMVIQ